jgi:hypothetical protein
MPIDRISPQTQNHGTRKNGKALRCSLCGAMSPKNPEKPTKNQRDCPVNKMKPLAESGEVFLKGQPALVSLSRDELDRILLWWELFHEGCWFDLLIAEKLTAAFSGRIPTRQDEYQDNRKKCAAGGCVSCYGTHIIADCESRLKNQKNRLLKHDKQSCLRSTAEEENEVCAKMAESDREDLSTFCGCGGVSGIRLSDAIRARRKGRNG